MRWSSPRAFCLLALAAVIVPTAALAEPIAFVVALKGAVHVTPAARKVGERAALG
jgi:hypothetical protein